MKAQTSRAPEDFIPVSEQVTPVIVKIGGGDMTSEIANQKTVFLDSPEMPFDSPEMTPSDQTWLQAISTLTGRIHMLSLRDGNLKNTYCSIVPQPDVLTSVEVKFGDEQLVLSEVPDSTEAGKYQLQIQSVGKSFNVSEPDPGREKKWYASQATFSSTEAVLTLTQSQTPSAGGEEIFKFEYVFNHSDTHFSLNFHVPINQ